MSRNHGWLVLDLYFRN